MNKLLVKYENISPMEKGTQMWLTNVVHNILVLGRVLSPFHGYSGSFLKYEKRKMV